MYVCGKCYKIYKTKKVYCHHPKTYIASPYMLTHISVYVETRHILHILEGKLDAYKELCDFKINSDNYNRRAKQQCSNIKKLMRIIKHRLHM